MSNDEFQRVEDVEKTNYFKKLAAPVAVAGICGAAALLLAGGKSTAAPESTEMIGQEFYKDTSLFTTNEQCFVSFDRMRRGNDPDFYNSYNLSNNLVNGKYEDPDFPANDSTLWWDMQNGSQQMAKYRSL